METGSTWSRSVREASVVLRTVLAFIILALLPQVRPPADTEEKPREDTASPPFSPEITLPSVT